ASVAPADSLDPLVMAFDAGSSSLRILVYDSRGRMIDGWEIHRPYSTHTTPDGGSFIDADFLLEQAVNVISAGLEMITRNGRTPAAVACDTFWHSLIGVDSAGRAVTPIYTWADTRSKQAAIELRRRLDQKAIHHRTGCGLHSSYWPAKLLWLHREHPELARKTRHWMSFGEYLYLRLFGERRVSISMASGTGLLDQKEATWDVELLQELPIETDQLSTLTDYDDALRGLQPSYAAEWPALAKVPWFLALGDGACNNVGSGGISEEWPVAMVGTSGALRVVRSSEQVKIPPHLWTYHVDRTCFVQGGALSAGGNLFAWLERLLRLGPVASQERALSAMSPDAHGLTILPFLAGERSPDWNPTARAAYVGMTFHTEGIDLLRASLEAIAYRFALIYGMLREVIPAPRGIIGSGAGLIHSPAWMQIMSDVLAEPLYASAVPEATSRGAALLVLEALGSINRDDTRPALGTEYAPNPTNGGIYRSAMERQQQLYRALIGPPPREETP
ncbi:MAG: gluconokinase, partial [Chloroflexota bacterium]